MRASGTNLLQPGAGPLHRFHAVVDKIDLAAPSQFAQDRFPNEFVAGSDDLRANGQTAGRRRVDDREISHARHGHLQRARNRCGRERQDVDLRAQLLQSFLVFDAEPLFLIDDHQPEIAEDHVFLEEPMRPDDHIDGSCRQIFQNGLGFFRRLES